MTKDISPPNGSETKRRSWIPLAMVVFATCAAFFNSFDGVFVFDDKWWIVESQILDQSIWHGIQIRPMVFLSLLMNNAISGRTNDGIWSYHLFNLAVHVLSAIMMFLLIRRTLALSPGTKLCVGNDTFAACCATLWAIHPLQTESVTYIIQRAESMAGLFYICGMYCVACGATATRKYLWYIAAMGFCAIGGLTKEAMITAPIMIFFYDLIFVHPYVASAENPQPVKSSFLRNVWRTIRRGWIFYGGMAIVAVAMIPRIMAVMAAAAEENTGVEAMTRMQYMQTQFKVMAYYIYLSFWPKELCLDYCWPATTELSQMLPYAIFILAVAAATIVAMFKWPRVGFLGLFFFVNLAPRSSIIPRPDIIVEHRMYLPLAGIVISVMLLLAKAIGAIPQKTAQGGEDSKRKFSTAVLVAITAILVAALIVRTARRNEDYQDEATIWEATVQVSPNSWRAWFNYGLAMDLPTKRWDDPRLILAEKYYRRAMELGHASEKVFNNYGFVAYRLGNVLAQNNKPDTAQDMFDKAEKYYQKALEKNPNAKLVYYNYGNLCWMKRDNASAEKYYRKAIQCPPLSGKEQIETYGNLAKLVLEKGQIDEALGYLQQALKLDPENVKTQTNLGTALIIAGKYDEAITHLRRALQIDPSHYQAENNLRIAIKRKATSMPTSSTATAPVVTN